MAESLENKTAKKLRAEEWPLAARVSCFNAHIKRSQDLFGIIDVLAVGPAGVLMVQVTSDSNVSTRVKKMCRDNRDTTLALVRAPEVRVEVWGWKKVSGRWQTRRLHLTEEFVLAVGA